jgi:CHAD domain-containing protein
METLRKARKIFEVWIRKRPDWMPARGDKNSLPLHTPANPLCFSRHVNPNFPPRLAGHLAESVRSARRRYRKRLRRCQDKFSEKAVHDLRIETRRILALLDLLEALHFEATFNKLRRTFKKRLDCFDDLRDTHVQRVLLKPLWAKFPEAKDFKKHLRKCEKRLEAQMSRQIRKAKCGQLNHVLKEIEQRLCECGGNPATGRSVSQTELLLGGAFRRVLALRRQIRRSVPKTIHRMRIAFKQFRYTAELLQPFLPDFTPERLQRMKDFQDAAGNIQDVAVLLERIDNDIKHEEISAACVKNLRRELQRCEHQAIDALMERIHELMDFEPKNSKSAAAELHT